MFRATVSAAMVKTGIQLLVWSETTQLAQLGECRSAEQEVVNLNPGWTNTQGLKITEEKVLSL